MADVSKVGLESGDMDRGKKATDLEDILQNLDLREDEDQCVILGEDIEELKAEAVDGSG